MRNRKELKNVRGFLKKAAVSGLCLTMTVGMMTGCGASSSTSSASTEDTSADSSENTAPSKPVELTVWHDGDESIMQTMQDSVNDQLKDENITVTFEKKSGLTDQLKLYGSDESNGPDMYFYAHDSLGMLAQMQILAPITDFISEDDEADMIDMTKQACTYHDTQYQLPLYYETLLFMYNKDKWDGDVPSTTDELLGYMKSHTKGDEYGVLNQHSTAYNVAPVINGYGGAILTDDGKPGLNTQEYKDAVAYNKQFAELQGDGDYNTITELFNEGKADAVIGGPWLVSGIKDAGINLGIKSLADFTLPNGKALAPYSGVQGIGVMKYVENDSDKKAAVSEVLKALATPETGIALAKEANCAPANEKSYDDSDVQNNEMIMAIKETAETAVPMPNAPEMSVMWGPAEEMLAAVNKSGEDIDTAADKYQKEAESAIADMQ